MDIKNNKILNFNEKKDVTNVWMNPGIYHLSKDIERLIPKKGSLEGVVFPKMVKEQESGNGEIQECICGFQ